MLLKVFLKKFIIVFVVDFLFGSFSFRMAFSPMGVSKFHGD